MGVCAIRRYGKLAAAAERLLEQAMARFGLSARAHDRIRRVTRTIADFLVRKIGDVSGKAEPFAGCLSHMLALSWKEQSSRL